MIINIGGRARPTKSLLLRDKTKLSTFILKLEKIVGEVTDTINYKPLMISVLKSLTFGY